MIIEIKTCTLVPASDVNVTSLYENSVVDNRNRFVECYNTDYRHHYQDGVTGSITPQHYYSTTLGKFFTYLCLPC